MPYFAAKPIPQSIPPADEVSADYRAREPKDKGTVKEALTAAQTELDTLLRLLEEQGQRVGAQAGMPMRVEQGPNREWAIVIGPVSTTIKWDQPVANSIRDAALVVKGWNRVHSFAPHARDDGQKPTSEIWFVLDLEGGRWMWREATRGQRTAQVTATDGVADTILRDLVTRAFTPADKREGYRSVRG